MIVVGNLSLVMRSFGLIYVNAPAQEAETVRTARSFSSDSSVIWRPCLIFETQPLTNPLLLSLTLFSIVQNHMNHNHKVIKISELSLSLSLENNCEYIGWIGRFEW